MADPRVSVILPTWNRAALLPRAIASVFAQTEPDLELIVVDDGSTDGTAELLQGVVDPRLRTEVLERNQGAAAARNVGIAKARGSFLAFHDSDDEWTRGFLARHLEVLTAHPDVDVTSVDLERVHRDDSVSVQPAPDIVPGRWIDPERGFYQVYGLGIHASVFRRKCFATRPWFDESLRCFEDLELFARLAQHHRFLAIHEPLARYYENEGVSTDLENHLRARRALLARWGRDLARRHPVFVLTELAKVHKGLLELALRRR